MDKQTRIYNRAKELSRVIRANLSTHGLMPFEMMEAKMQQKYLDLATEQIHQEDAGQDALRDELKAAEMLPNQSLSSGTAAILDPAAGKYMLAAMMQFNEPGYNMTVVKSLITVEVFMALYYGEVSIEDAKSLLHKYYSNAMDKARQVAAQRGTRKPDKGAGHV